MKTFSALPILFLALTASIVIAGCGDTPGPDPKLEAERLKSAQTLRGYYDRSQGNFDALSQSDKDAYIKLAGGEQKAQTLWGQMKYGPGGAPAGAPPTMAGSSNISHDGPQANGR